MRRSLSILLAAVLLVGCGGASDGPNGNGALSVLYAGSLAAIMEDEIGPAFTTASGIEFEGEAHGSLGAAQLIRDGLRDPDVFVSADPLVNEQVLMGPNNEHLVQWYVTFASSELVLGFNPEGPHAAEFEAAASGEKPWYDVLLDPDIQFGRGDPTIDPKGYRTLFMFELAAAHHGDSRLSALVEDPSDPDQVLPEVSLLARVDTGQFDGGIFYRHEAVAAGLPYVRLPDEINLGDPSLADQYATASYTTPDGDTYTGAPITFTVTIPATVINERSAIEFVSFLLSSSQELEDLGFRPLEPVVHGEDSAVPEELDDAINGT